MSLRIVVHSTAVKEVTKQARLVPNERIDDALDKLEALEETLLSWKGEAKPAFDEVHEDVKETLNHTKNLMNTILSVLDQTVDDIYSVDVELSERFERAVDHYTTD